MQRAEDPRTVTLLALAAEDLLTSVHAADELNTALVKLSAPSTQRTHTHHGAGNLAERPM